MTFHVPELLTCGSFFQKARNLRSLTTFESLIDFISQALAEKTVLDDVKRFLEGNFLIECNMIPIQEWLPLLFGLAHSDAALSLNSRVITPESDGVETLISLNLTEDYLLSDESEVVVKGVRLGLPVSSRDCIGKLEQILRDAGFLSDTISRFSPSPKSSFHNLFPDGTKLISIFLLPTFFDESGRLEKRAIFLFRA
jgi:hypothetical protein